MAKAKKPVAKKSGPTTARKSTTAKKPTTSRKTTASASKATEVADAKVQTSTAVSPSDLKKEMEASGKPTPDVAKEPTGTGEADDKVKSEVEAGETEKRAESAPAPVAPAAPSASQPAESGSIFWPLVLGGLLAGVIGFLASELDLIGSRGQTDDLRASVSKQDARLTVLENTEIPEVTFPDIDGLTAQVEGVSTQIADLSTRLDGIDSRLTDVEKRPITGGSSQAAVAAYERELAALQASVEEQRAEIEGLLDNALSVEEATAGAARTARLQAALTDVANAINSGQPFDTALASMTEDGVADIPAALNDVASEGVQTLNALQSEFPDNARGSLAAARASGTDESESGFGGFLKRQLGARSVTPREGNSPDAVLSRAEAAVREGRLADALTEIEALPAPAQEAMQSWLDSARARQAAEAATKDLSQSLTAN